VDVRGGVAVVGCDETDAKGGVDIRDPVEPHRFVYCRIECGMIDEL
jgi:hypothetical protein